MNTEILHHEAKVLQLMWDRYTEEQQADIDRLRANNAAILAEIDSILAKLKGGQ